MKCITQWVKNQQQQQQKPFKVGKLMSVRWAFWKEWKQAKDEQRTTTTRNYDALVFGIWYFSRFLCGVLLSTTIKFNIEHCSQWRFQVWKIVRFFLMVLITSSFESMLTKVIIHIFKMIVISERKPIFGSLNRYIGIRKRRKIIIFAFLANLCKRFFD